MKIIGVFVSENFQFLEVKFSIYLNRSVFVMIQINLTNTECSLKECKILRNSPLLFLLIWRSHFALSFVCTCLLSVTTLSLYRRFSHR